MFGAPNGLCSSMTEAKHIKAVKEPWRRSSRYEPLGQMLLTNQRLDKLAASRIDFTSRGMLDGSVLDAALQYSCAYPLCLFSHVIDFLFQIAFGKMTICTRKTVVPTVNLLCHHLRQHQT